MCTLQERNEQMVQLRDLLKSFLKTEGDPYDHCIITMQETNKALDVLVDCHDSGRRDKIAARLLLFGFPKPTAAPVRLVFSGFESQPILRGGDYLSEVVSESETEKIFAFLKQKFKEKNWGNLVVKGTGFIRVQKKEFGRRAASMIKTFFTNVKPFCTGEDVVLYRKTTQQVNISGFMGYLKELIGGIFGFQMLPPLQNGDTVIIGLSSEKDLEDVKFFATYFGLQEPVQNGQTLVFKGEDPSVSLEEARAEWEAKKPEEKKVVEHAETALSEDLVTSSPEDFKKSVRQFLKDNNIPRIEGGTLREVEPFHYQIAISSEHHRLLMELAEKKCPEWTLEKRGETTISFFHGTLYKKDGSSKTIEKAEKHEGVNESEEWLLTIQGFFSRDNIWQILNQISDDLIAKEAKRRGLLPSGKQVFESMPPEEQQAVLSVTTEEALIAEVKRRGPLFAKTLFGELIG